MNKYSGSQLLEGQVALISGASRGIGRKIAEILSFYGADLVINGTNHDALNQTKQLISKIGRRCLIVAGDISKHKTSITIVRNAMEEFGRIDILVNNSGIIYRRPFELFNLEEWNKTLAINLEGTVFTSYEVLEEMKKRGKGKIVNILSSAVKAPHSNASIGYGVSKAGALYLTRHLAREYASYGININAVCPGPIETDMVKDWDSNYRKTVLKKIPMGRLGLPVDVANVVFFLCSRLSDFITGEAINVNGGTIMD